VTPGPSRLRRPQNLKPCHEIASALGAWRRVIAVEPHEHMADTLIIWAASEHHDDGRRAILRRRNQPVLSRLADPP
jgi:hypothetical protein